MTSSLPQRGPDTEAGRELDALVAERVMGLVWDCERCRVCGWPLANGLNERDHCLPDNCSQRPAPVLRADRNAPYSSDIASAFLVVEAMRAKGWAFMCDDNLGALPWFVEFRNDYLPNAPISARCDANSLSLAICECALTALAAASPAPAPLEDSQGAVTPDTGAQDQ